MSLCSEKMTINEISDSISFKEPSNTAKFFKKYEKITPSEFKERQMGINKDL